MFMIGNECNEKITLRCSDNLEFYFYNILKKCWQLNSENSYQGLLRL